jgi:hypothetical protein
LYNEYMESYLKESIHDLIHLRTNVFSVVIVLTGGLCSLLFMNSLPLYVFIFAAFGAYLDILFIGNILELTNKIEIYRKEFKK